jgi:hypothetical protein
LEVGSLAQLELSSSPDKRSNGKTPHFGKSAAQSSPVAASEIREYGEIRGTENHEFIIFIIHYS